MNLSNHFRGIFIAIGVVIVLSQHFHSCQWHFGLLNARILFLEECAQNDGAKQVHEARQKSRRCVQIEAQRCAIEKGEARVGEGIEQQLEGCNDQITLWHGNSRNAFPPGPPVEPNACPQVT